MNGLLFDINIQGLHAQVHHLMKFLAVASVRVNRSIRAETNFYALGQSFLKSFMNSIPEIAGH